MFFGGVGPMSSSPWGYFSKLLVGLGADFGGGPMFPMPWLLVCLSGEAAERDLSGEAAGVIISVVEIMVVEPFIQFKCSF